MAKVKSRKVNPKGKQTELLTTEKLLEILESRGLKVLLSPDGKPFLRGDASGVSQTVRDLLPFHRQRIVEIIQSKGVEPVEPNVKGNGEGK